MESVKTTCQDSPRAGLSYLECVYWSCGLIAPTLGSHMDAQVRAARIAEAFSAITKLADRGLPHIQSTDHCRTVQHRLEHFALRIHSNFALTYLSLRAAHLPDRIIPESQPNAMRGHRGSCLQTLQAFLDMQAAGGLPERSWVFMHDAMSSALLLGFSKGQIDQKAKKLQGLFLQCLERFKEESNRVDIPASGFHNRYTRAVETLQKMCKDSSDEALDTQESSRSGMQSFTFSNENIDHTL